MLANNSSIELKDGKSTSEILELTYLFQVTFLTVFGNVMVIFAFIFGPRSIRTLTNYFLVNLSVSDLLVGFISIPFWIVFRIGKFNYLRTTDNGMHFCSLLLFILIIWQILILRTSLYVFLHHYFACEDEAFKANFNFRINFTDKLS